MKKHDVKQDSLSQQEFSGQGKDSSSEEDEEEEDD